MRIAVTGRHGQVATSLAERAGAGEEIILLGRPELDLAGDPAAIAAAMAAARPDVVISAAAYTAVDKAESEAAEAEAVNARGAGAVAAAAHALGVPVLHLSTDYVFDGTKPLPYVENDPTGPTGVYGRTKLAGEEAVLAAHPNAIVCRTAWVYSPFGHNFVKTMLRLAGDRDEVRVVADQIGNPTSALDIADALLGLSRAVRGGNEAAGVFHLAGTGEASWADFAEAIFAASAAAGGPTAQVIRIATADFPTPTARPANSRLNCDRLEREFGIRLPEWQTSTATIVRRLVG